MGLFLVCMAVSQRQHLHVLDPDGAGGLVGGWEQSRLLEPMAQEDPSLAEPGTGPLGLNV